MLLNRALWQLTIHNFCPGVQLAEFSPKLQASRCFSAGKEFSSDHSRLASHIGLFCDFPGFLWHRLLQPACSRGRISTKVSSSDEDALSILGRLFVLIYSRS